MAAEKAAGEKLQAVEAIQNDHEQRSNQWEVSPLIHLLRFLKIGKGKILNKVSPHQGMPRYNEKKYSTSVDQITMSRGEPSMGMALTQPSHFPRFTMFLLICMSSMPPY